MTTELTFDDRAKASAGKAAIASLAAHMEKEGKGLIKALKPVLAAFTVDDAKPLMIEVNRLVALKKKRLPKMPSPQRISAVRGLKKAEAWASWPAFYTTLEKMDPTSWDDIIMLCNWYRSPALKLDKASKVPPTEEQAKAELTRLEVARTVAAAKRKADAEAAKKLQPVDHVRAAPLQTLDSAIAGLTLLSEIEPKGKGRDFLTAAIKSLAAYRPAAVERQVEAAAAKAATAAREELAKAAVASGK